MKHIKTLIISTTLAFFSTSVWAAPTCNPVPYGTKCTQCSGWMGYSSWKTVACTLNSAPTAAGFTCSTFKCGVVKKVDVDIKTQLLTKPEIKSDIKAETPVASEVKAAPPLATPPVVPEVKAAPPLATPPATPEVKAIESDKKVDNDVQKKHNYVGHVTLLR